MLLKPGSVVETSLQTVLDFYQKFIVPNATRRNKTLSLSLAVSLYLIYYVREHVLKPPKNLRHIPYVGYFDLIKSVFNKQSFADMEYKFTIPLINAEGSNQSVFLKPGRLGWEAHINNPIDVKRILMKQDLFPKATDSEENKAFSKTLVSRFIGGPNIVLLGGTRWKKQRMVANPAFHRAMPVQLFGNLTLDLFKVLDNQVGESVNVSNLLQRWTLDAIGAAGFGFNFNAITQPEGEWLQTYNVINDALLDPFFFAFPRCDQELLWMFPKRQAIHRQLDKFLATIDHIIELKRQKIQDGDLTNDVLDESERDLLTLMIESESRGEGGMSDEELKSNICMFFFAGHDTTSSALSFALYFLATHPDVQQKAREEALSVLGNEPVDVLPTIEDTRQMAYINQVIKETLRLGSPAPQVAPRYTTEDNEFSGVFVPKGTCVTVNMFNMHHSNKVWDNPEKFDPDRFQDDGDKVTSQQMDWAPFGGGPRQCIGFNFSLNEQRVLLSMLLRKYEWRLPEDSIHKDKLIIEGINIISPKQLNLVFKKRY